MIFKTVSKQLLQEGITPPLLNWVQNCPSNLHVILEPGDDPVMVLKAGTDQWYVKAGGDDLLRDGAGYFTVKDRQVFVGKARYWLAHRQEIVSAEAERLFQIEAEKVKKQASDLVRKFDEVCVMAHGKRKFGPEQVIDQMMYSVAQPTDDDALIAKALGTEAQSRSATARDTLGQNPAWEQSTEQINAMLQSEDWDGLFVTLRQNGLPTLFKSKQGDIADEATLKAFFGKDKIEGTTETLRERGHLYTWCLMQANLKFQPFSAT